MTFLSLFDPQHKGDINIAAANMITNEQKYKNAAKPEFK